MMQCVKYALAWLYGAVYIGSAWFMCTDYGTSSKSIFTVVAVLILIIGTLGIIALPAAKLIEHWNDDSD